MDNQPPQESTWWASLFAYLTAENAFVFMLTEAIGLPFCYTGPDFIMHGEIGKGLLAFAIGLPFVGLGVSWPFLKESVPKGFADSVRLIIFDFRGWLAVAFVASIYLFVLPQLRGASRPSRHISREAAEKFQDVIAPYGSIQSPTQRGTAILTRCQTLESADLLRDIYDPFYNVHWNVHEVTGEAARFYRDGTVYVQGTFPDDINKALNALFRDSGIAAHVRRLGTPKPGQMPEMGIDVECNE